MIFSNIIEEEFRTVHITKCKKEKKNDEDNGRIDVDFVWIKLIE